MSARGTVTVVIAAGAQDYLPKTFKPETPVAGRPLTPREVEVLTIAARGASHKEIARALDVAELTIKLHTKRIVTKL